MALPINHPLHEVEVLGALTNVSSSSVVSLHAPFTGRIVKLGAIIGSTAATGDATLTTNINGTAITGGVITVVQTASTVGQVFTATPTALNVVKEDDSIGVVVTGSATLGGPCIVFAKIRQGTN